MTRRIAVVGSGVAGLVAAHVASRTAHVTLFEADARLGGHADTHTVSRPTGDELAIDTGFIVHNERTYPVLLRLFAELGVETQESEMSMSVWDIGSGLEYAGALGPRGLFPSRRNLARPAYLRMLVEIPRFHRRARALLETAEDAPGSHPDETLRDFLARGRFTAYFQRHFMEPLVAAVWSTDPDLALDYPARYLFSFLQHHGMLGVFGSPQWRTVTGGSREYVRRVGAGLPDVRLGTKVTSVLETADGVEITDGNGEVSTYDAVVIATHPDQALAMLAEPTPLQRDVLSAMPYSPNTAQLHTDTSLLPNEPNAWASWNFQRPRDTAGQVTVTYDLTRLQRLDTDTHYLVTLGGTDLVDPVEGHRDDGVRPPDLHPRVRRRAAPAARDRDLAAGLRRRVPRLGLPRGRRPLRPRRRRAAGLRRGPRPTGPRGVRRSPSSTRPPSGTSAASRSGTGSPTARTAGWSTSTRCPRRAVPRRSWPATTSARPT